MSQVENIPAAAVVRKQWFLSDIARALGVSTNTLAKRFRDDFKRRAGNEHVADISLSEVKEIDNIEAIIVLLQCYANEGNKDAKSLLLDANGTTERNRTTERNGTTERNDGTERNEVAQ